MAEDEIAVTLKITRETDGLYRYFTSESHSKFAVYGHCANVAGMLVVIEGILDDVEKRASAKSETV